MLEEPLNNTEEEGHSGIQTIIAGIKKGDPESLRQFFDDYSDEIYNYPLRYNNFSEDEAADFYLYAFEHLKNGKKLSSFQGKSKFSTWLFTVLRNLVIDFLRTKREKIRITSLSVIDSSGTEFDGLQNIADNHHEISDFEDELTSEFLAIIDNLPFKQKILIKLAFINYFDFNKTEIEWLAGTNKKTHSEIIEEIIKLKDIGFQKANEIKKIEDKLTANFQFIGAIETRIFKFFQDHPELDKSSQEWTEEFVSDKYPEEINLLIQNLIKKKNKHLSLLQQQKKSMISTRIPYKDFAYLLNSSEGVLSVQLSRILKKINDDMERK